MAKLKEITCKLRKMILQEFKQRIASDFDRLFSNIKPLEGTHYPYLLYNNMRRMNLIDEPKYKQFLTLFQKHMTDPRFISNLNDSNCNEILYFYYNYFDEKSEFERLESFHGFYQSNHPFLCEDSKIMFRDLFQIKRDPEFRPSDYLKLQQVIMPQSFSLQYTSNCELIIKGKKTKTEILFVDDSLPDFYSNFQSKIKNSSPRAIFVEAPSTLIGLSTKFGP